NERELKAAGVEILACERVDGRIALPELLDDLGARGVMNLLVEGGAAVAVSFLAEDLVDALALFTSPKAIGTGIPAERRIASPILADGVHDRFELTGAWQFGEDRLQSFSRRR
ncbi:MAG TPA: dihydrofolate reductase family protein, partial [Rhizobiaceae bacterium]|nr:dihydrofolate reductase family protein [Rhizobiaceae bacterium]